MSEKPIAQPGPLVTIGLPVFNGERFFRPCIESLLAQTYPHVEIIISDNASTDATPTICAEFARRNERIRYVRAEENRGAAWNHNRVIELARGELFKWVGADDVLAPEYVDACVTALRNRPDAVLAYPKTILIDDEGQAFDRTTSHLPVDSPDPIVRFRALLSALALTQNVHYGLMRLSNVRQVPPLGTFLASDRCFIAELSLMGPFVEVGDYLMYRRIHAGNRVRTHEAERTHADPVNVKAYRPRELRVLFEHVATIWRARAPLRTKARLIATIARSVPSQTAILLGEVRGLLAHKLRQVRSGAGASSAPRVTPPRAAQHRP